MCWLLRMWGKIKGKIRLRNCKNFSEAEKNADRFGKEYFSVTIVEHLELLRGAGFYTVEIFWVSYMQAGFYAVK
jgi:tRNA (cmo5U34)-methyltransferase